MSMELQDFLTTIAGDFVILVILLLIIQGIINIVEDLKAKHNRKNNNNRPKYS
jgi:hypothetical protein